MKMLFVLIILAVILLSVAIVIFFWAVKRRQFDDLEVHAYNILKDDVYEEIPESNLSETLDEKQDKISHKNLDKLHGKK